MSTAPAVSASFAQLPTRGEHLVVHTKMDGIHSHQSFPSAEESIDEVQIGFDAQTDELSMDDDRALIDELEEDINDGLQYPSNSDSRVNSNQVNGEPGAVETPQLTDQAHGANNATAAGPDQVLSIEEAPEELPQTDAEINSMVSKTDVILQAEALGTVDATNNGDLVSLEEQDNLDISEGEDVEFSVPLTEQEISVITRNFEREIEELTANPSERQQNEQDSTQPDIQTTESEPVVVTEPVVEPHQVIDAPPLRRMDGDTISVTDHSKESIIEVLQDAPDATADESIQFVIMEEQAPQESEPITTTEIAPKQVDMEVDAQAVIPPEGPASASAVAHVEHIEVIESSKETEGKGIFAEQQPIVVEQGGEATIKTTVEESVDHQHIQIVQEGSTPAVQEESAAPDPTPEDIVTTSGEAAGPIVAVVEQSTTITEQTSVEQAEQTESSVANPAPVVTMDTTTTSSTALISIDPAVVDPVVSTTVPGDMGMDHVERAAQIQQEQDATAQATEDETQATLVESIVSVNDTVVTDDAPDPTAPKDSDSPLRRAASQSQSQSQPDLVAPEPMALSNPLVTQDKETNTPEESSEQTNLQYQITTDQPETTPDTGPCNTQTPEWEGFAALDEDAHGSPEPEPSSEPSEYPDVVTEDSPVNPTSASTDKTEEPSNSPTTPAPRRKKKPKLIMEVVIPITREKPKAVHETKIIKKRRPGRPPKATKSAKVPAPSKSESLAASSSSPPRRSFSTGTPSPVKSEASEPVSRMKRPVAKHPRPSSSLKRAKKAVASGSRAGTRPVHAAHAAKVEVVITRKPRPSVLKGLESTPSGNNVKFASNSPATLKRKAESEPEADEEETDADADGETDDDYEDVEEDPKVKLEVVIPPRKRQKKTQAFTKGRSSPVKRPRRSNEARKTPAKMPETVNKSPRPVSKRRRLRR